MEEDGAGGIDGVVTEFNTYEDFLDSQITPLDLYYLEVRIGLFLKHGMLIFTTHRLNLRLNYELPSPFHYNQTLIPFRVLQCKRSLLF